jgi:transcriptional regulator with XRE-family HTH domain
MISTSGVNIKLIRVKLGFEQVEFAALFGKTNHAVSSWERGTTKKIPQDVVMKLRDDYNVNPDFIYGRSDQMFLAGGLRKVQEEVELLDKPDVHELITRRFVHQVLAYQKNHPQKSNRDFATWLDVNEDILSKVMTGKRTASLDFMHRAGSKMKINFHYTFTGRGEIFEQGELNMTLVTMRSELDEVKAVLKKFETGEKEYTKETA